MRRLAAALSLCILAATAFSADLAGPVLVIPGAPDKTIAPATLLGAGKADVKLDDSATPTVYRGMPLLEVLEKNGLDVEGMPSLRKSAPAIVVAQARDGYTVAFSIGELLMHRSDPRVFLVAETADGPLPADQGPVRLIVVGQRARSAYGLARIEVRYLAENKPSKKP